MIQQNELTEKYLYDKIDHKGNGRPEMEHLQYSNQSRPVYHKCK